MAAVTATGYSVPWEPPPSSPSSSASSPSPRAGGPALLALALALMQPVLAEPPPCSAAVTAQSMAMSTADQTTAKVAAAAVEAGSVSEQPLPPASSRVMTTVSVASGADLTGLGPSPTLFLTARPATVKQPFASRKVCRYGWDTNYHAYL